MGYFGLFGGLFAKFDYSRDWRFPAEVNFQNFIGADIPTFSQLIGINSAGQFVPQTLSTCAGQSHLDFALQTEQL
jgi:S1-C subfamily serine protease